MPRKISSCSIAMNLRAVVEKASLLGTPDSQSRGQGCSPFWVSRPQHPGWPGLAPLTIRTLIAPLLFHLQSTFFWLLYCFHNFGHFFFLKCPSFPIGPLCDFLPCDWWRPLTTEFFSHSLHTFLIPLYPVAEPFSFWTSSFHLYLTSRAFF